MSGRCWQEQGCWQSIESMWPGAFPGKGDCHGRLDERNGNESVRSINDYGVHTYRVGVSHGWTYLSIPLFAVVARCLGGQVPMLSRRRETAANTGSTENGYAACVPKFA